ncbi:kinase-like domain-containing protein [Dichotomocladium elegans]|nr:kinase-like domain-containing protein [Dichotomocladium elegans]
MKIIDLDHFERNRIDELRRETTLMALSRHPNVLTVHGSFVRGSKLYIVMPYMAAGACLDIIKSGFHQGFEEITIATILKQALEGLVYLHKNGHIHRDIKAGNLLMDDQGTVLLADFGVASSFFDTNDRRKTFVGTPCWMAPEVMEQMDYDDKADIWSFGITAIELATGHAPYAKLPPMKVLMMTLSNKPPTIDREKTRHKYSRTFKDMVDWCLRKNPEERPSAAQLLLHPFFKQARRGDYLTRSILAAVPPIDKRPHHLAKKAMVLLPPTLLDDDRAIEETSITSWDFGTSPQSRQRQPSIMIKKKITTISVPSAPRRRSSTGRVDKEMPPPIPVTNKDAFISPLDPVPSEPLYSTKVHPTIVPAGQDPSRLMSLLVQQTETQRAMLIELMAHIIPAAYSSPPAAATTTTHSSPPIDQLRQLLATCQHEREVLTRENELLRRQLESMRRRRQQQQ